MKFFRNKKTGILMTYVAGMIALTIIAKIADSFMLPEVVAGNFEKMSLQYPVKITGEIRTEGVQAVYGTEGLRVGAVKVAEGDQVEPGDILFTYDMEFLDEQIRDSERELQKLSIQLDSSESNRKLMEEEKNKSINRANADYEVAVASSGATETEAYQDMEAARKKLEEHEKKKPKKPKKKTDKKAKDKKDTSEQKDTGSADATAEWKQQKELLEQDYEQKKRAYEAAVRAGDESEKNALRQIEDAKAPLEDNSSIKLQQLDKQEIEENLESLRKVKEAGGNVCSEISGEIQEVNVAIGEITGTSVAVLLEDFSQPFRFEGSADEKMAAHLKEGDTCNIKLINQSLFLENQKIDRVAELKNDSMGGMESSEMSSSNKMYKVRAKIDSDQVKKSDRAELELITESTVYQSCIPVTALYGDSSGDYILMAEEKATTLGMQIVAAKVPVKVLEKNDTYAAVEGDFDQNGKVILRAAKNISDGERIKVVKDK